MTRLVFFILFTFSITCLGNSAHPRPWEFICNEEGLEVGDKCLDDGERQGTCAQDLDCLENLVDYNRDLYDEDTVCLICECPNCEPIYYKNMLGCQSISITTSFGFLILAGFLFFNRKSSRFR